MHFETRVTSIVVLAALLLSGHVAARGQARPTPADATSALDAIVEQRMKEAGLVGVGAAIIVDKKLVWTKGYGFADKQRAVPFTPDTIMNIGSISKTFTGVALMRAVQDGKLSLDEDINAYLPFKVTNPHLPNERITLRQIATHTSGITDRWEVYEGCYHFGGDPQQQLGEFLSDYFTPNGKHYSKENFLNVKPGTHREYSNIAAGLAGYIVERAVGEKLNVYTKRQIFAPLKMRDTGWFLSEIDAAKHSKLYVSQDGFAIPIQLYGLTTYPDGGIRTSVADLSKFFCALLNGGEHDGTRILDKQLVDEMLRFQFTEADKPVNVNLKEKNSGIFWASKYNVTRVGHGGSDPGIKTEMLTDLSKEIGVILFTNTSPGEREMRTYSALFDDLWKHAVSRHREVGRSPAAH